MPWIRLTDHNKETVWINSDQFYKMKRIDNRTVLTAFSGSSSDGKATTSTISVQETPDEIMRLVSEGK